MIEFLQWVKIIRESIGDTLLIAFGGLLASFITWLYAKAKYRRERQFATASNEAKSRVFREIGALGSTHPNPQSDNIKNTLIQGIGIFIPWAWSDYVLRFARETGIQDSNIDLNAYLKSPQQMNDGKYTFSWSRKKYIHRLAEVWIVMLIETVTLLSMSLMFLFQATKGSDTQYAGLFFMTFITFVSWFILFIGFMVEAGRLYGAKRFHDKFSPWLKRKLNEEKAASAAPRQEVRPSEPVPEIRFPPVEPAAMIKRWLGKIWKI
ncbi:hypothetical protein ACQK5W_14200 [Pantoea sp. FN060301]|uniref:hypothetical protein n=1 Tax=Pantoea sp. FN060301 TaxID=3420380 RepID=UPI003D16F6D3